ncbi:uncharacterized protein LOC110700170 [Chenopodium quinoa]|uniref:Uncharacterized protein n=1 Tax=Chenopodium quinoa TaxID=63459 RepID=A0A803MVZ1_CHEQI|nr:uncharacterized protein LOC110700170 [Chenopodium quinoa]
MDVKSLAKSKRSHTQHHQPRKSYHHPSKNTSSSSSISNSATSKDGKDKKRTTQPSPPSLPSNWDRYDDEIEEDKIVFESDDVVKPKSKGADFSELIAQAKEAPSYFSNSFDDRMPEFCQGVAPMLAVRGEKIILQNRDDDFLMQDEAIGTKEIPSLTLDLKDLAERLSKVDLAKRLFVESDLFPPELHHQDARKADNQAPLHTSERRKIEKIDSFGELLALYLEEERMAKSQDVEKDGNMPSSNITSHHDPDPKSKSDSKGDVTLSQLDDMDFLDDRENVQPDHGSKKRAESKLDEVGQVSHVTKQVTNSKLDDLEFLDEKEKPEVSHVTEQEIRPLSRFEAASAEAELDMLLGSFNETKIFDTPLNQPGTSASYMTGHKANPLAPVQHSLGQSALAFPIISSLDNELDDLLAETSNPSNTDSLFRPTQVPSSSISQSGSNSKVLEDFDSWLDTI